MSPKTSHSAPARRQRPVETALPVHVLPSLHRLVLPDAIVFVVARHLAVFRRLKAREAQHLLQLPRVVVHVLGLLCVLLHLDVGGLLLLDDIAGRGRSLDGAAAGYEVGSARAGGS